MSRPFVEAAALLADVLSKENEALKTMNLRAAAALLPDKTAAIAALTASGDAIMAGSSGWKKGEGKGSQEKLSQGILTASWIAAARRLDTVVMENRRLLERAIVAQERVIGIVAQAASSARDTTYGSKGRANRPMMAMAFSTRA